MKREADVMLLLFVTLALSTTNAKFGIIREAALVLRWGFIALMCFFYLANRQFRALDLVDLMFVLFIAQSFFSYNYSINPDMTLKRSVLLLAVYFVVFFEVRRFSSFKQGVVAIRTVLRRYSKFIILLIIIGYPLGANSYGVGSDRFYGIFANPNALGAFTVVAIPTLFSNLSGNRKKRLSDAFFLAVAAGLLFLSGSRTSILAVFLALGLYIFAITKNKLIYLLGGVILLPAVMILPQFIKAQDISEAVEQKMRLGEIKALGGRAEAWQAARECIMKRPVLGHGYGAEEYMFDYYGFEFQENAGGHTHNSYLGLLATNGVLGFLLIFPVLCKTLFNSLRLYRLRSRFGPEQSTVVLLVAIAMGLMLHAFAESWLFSFGSMLSMVFWTLAATIWTLAAALRKK